MTIAYRDSLQPIARPMLPHDAAGAAPLPTETNPDILLALARVEASLQIVLAAIADLKAEMNRSNQTAPAAANAPPLRPDPSWVGTP